MHFCVITVKRKKNGNICFIHACKKIVCDELDEVFGEDTGREVGTKDLARLKYLDMCIKESLRLFPPVTLIAREATNEVELGELSIVKDSMPRVKKAV